MRGGASGSRLVVGKPARRGDVALCLDAFELEQARAADAQAVEFGEAMDGGGAEACERAEIRVPSWRGYRFLDLLDWLVRARLVQPGGEVAWEVPRRVAGGAARLLAGAGWTLVRTREQDAALLTGAAPQAGERPEPLTFEGELLGRRFSFAADWGVFSQDTVDPGTALLAGIAGSLDCASIADVGTGYGPLAIALASTPSRPQLVASELDAVALWLARRNAAANGVAVEFLLTPDPRTLPATELTVCNFPTHAAPANRQALLGALEARGRGSRLLLGCHKSLVPRFTDLQLEQTPTVTIEGDHAAVLY